jgi:hypothetical protein
MMRAIAGEILLMLRPLSCSRIAAASKKGKKGQDLPLRKDLFDIDGSKGRLRTIFFSFAHKDFAEIWKAPVENWCAQS